MNDRAFLRSHYFSSTPLFVTMGEATVDPPNRRLVIFELPAQVQTGF
jgi:hypothetical protein